MEQNTQPSKSLITINILMRVFYVLAIVFMVLSIINAISGISGCIILLSDKDKVVGPDGMMLWQRIAAEFLKRGFNVSIYTIALLLLNVGIYSIAMFVMYNFARMYFKSVLADGTPFTTKAGNGMRKLGWLYFIVGVAMFLVGLICYGIFAGVFKNDIRGNVMYIGIGWGGFSVGLVFLIISLFISASIETNSNNQEKNN